MEAVALTSIVVRNNSVPATPVDQDLVIVSLEGSNYIGLDQIGRTIWEALEQPLHVHELCARLAKLYAGGREHIAHDVLLFLTEMRDEGLILVDS